MGQWTHSSCVKTVVTWMTDSHGPGYVCMCVLCNWPNGSLTVFLRAEKVICLAGLALDSHQP